LVNVIFHLMEIKIIVTVCKNIINTRKKTSFQI